MRSTPHTTRRALVALATLALVVGLAGPASASSAFEFNGSGWGHGVGMSQYGALEQARDGRSAEQIIAHYYQGARAAKPSLGLGSRDILVGLSQNITSVTATARGAGMVVRFSGNNYAVGRNGTAKIQFLSSGYCRLQTSAGHEKRRADCTADVTPRSGGSIALSNESVVYAANRIDRIQIRPRSSGSAAFHVSAEVKDIEQYLKGLREVPASWPLQTLRAQAIAARSYAAYDLLGGGLNRSSCNCHLYDSVRSQVYGGSTGETEAWRNAVQTTTGQVVYAPGETGTRDGVVQAFYSSSSGGRTEAIEDSSSFGAGPRSYFSSVNDPWSLRSSNPYASWTINVSESLIRSRLALDDVTSIQVTSRNESGSARTVQFNGSRNGSSATRVRAGDELRGLLGLRSGYIRSVFLPPFVDDDGNVHEANIAWMDAEDYTGGCNPPRNDRYCPNEPVTRAQMATFLLRVLNLTPRAENFDDVPDGSTHAKSIGALARTGITEGCNPPRNNLFCPKDPVSRDQMATFIHRMER